MALERPVADVERLVVDEEADELAVRHVDERLALLGVAVAGLRVGQRQATRRSRSGRCRARRAVPPRRGCRVARYGRSTARRRTRSGRAGRDARSRSATAHGSTEKMPGSITAAPAVPLRSLTTMSAPCCRSDAARPARSIPTTHPKPPARPASTPATASSNTAALRWRDAQAPRPRQGTCPARASRAGSLPAATTPSTRTSKRCSMPAAARTSWQFLLADTTARRRPAVAGRLHESHRALVHLDALVARSARGRGRSCGSRARAPSWPSAGRRTTPSGSVMPRDARKSRTPSGGACRRRTARSHATGRTARNGSPVRLDSVVQECIEHLLPRLRMDLRRLCQHTVEVEQTRGDPGRNDHVGTPSDIVTPIPSLPPSFPYQLAIEHRALSTDRARGREGPVSEPSITRKAGRCTVVPRKREVLGCEAAPRRPRRIG